MSPDGLGVLRILDFQPAGAIALVDAEPALRNNSFQVPLADLVEERDALSLNMLGVDDSFEPLLDDSVLTLLSIDEWQRPQILTIKPQQVECVEDWFALSGKQFVELAHATVIEAYDFAVQDGVLNGQFPERFLQRCELLETVHVSRDEFALASTSKGVATLRQAFNIYFP